MRLILSMRLNLLPAAKIENEGLFFDWEYEPIELHVHEIRDDKPNSA